MRPKTFADEQELRAEVADALGYRGTASHQAWIKSKQAGIAPKPLTNSAVEQALAKLRAISDALHKKDEEAAHSCAADLTR